MNTDESVSPYYPPRARWYSRLCYPWLRLGYLLHLDRIHLPGDISWWQFGLSLVVPGFAFWALGRRALGYSLLAAYCLSGLIFLPALGYPLASLCVCLLLSIHVVSLFYLELTWLGDCRLRFKVLCACITVAAVLMLVYLPGIHYIDRHWFVPLRTGDRVIVVSRAKPPEFVRRGDWAAYRSPGARAPGVYVQAGFEFGPVLAAGGDRVEFGSKSFLVNGVPQRRLARMPVTGELVVPQNHWLIWPEFDINERHGEVNEATLSGLLLQMATVPQDRLIGKPYPRWFWRRQSLPPPS